jgi:hypothetical protein
MTIDIVIRAGDNFGNTIYFIRENGHWRSMTENCTPLSFSNYSSNSAELYIALENSSTKEDATNAVNTYADFIKKGSAK